MSSWLNILKSEVEQSSQRVVGGKIGYSTATISLVLNGNYKGDLRAVENAVNKKLRSSAVPCPILGDISAADCTTNQNKPFSAANSAKVRLFKACRDCPYNTKRKEQSS